MIKKIIIAEFHDIAGRQIVIQYPGNADDLPLDFLVPKEELCKKITMTEYQSDYLLSYATILRSRENEPFTRSLYIFSVSIQVNKEDQQKLEQYQEVVRKLAYMLTQLQLSKNLVYNHKEYKKELSDVIENIYEGLANDKESFTLYDDSNYMFLTIKEFQKPYQAADLKYNHVPFPLVELKTGVQSQYNPVISAIIGEINGVNCIGNICEKLKPITSYRIKDGLQELLEYNLIQLVDIIHMTNIYVLNQQFFSNLRVHAGLFNDDSLPINKQIPVLQSLYCGFRRDTNLREYIKNNAKLLKYVNLTRLIRYGQLSGFLVRLHEYPIQKSNSSTNFFESSDFKLYLSKFISPQSRFSEEEQEFVQKTSAKIPVVHSKSQTIEHSSIHETGLSNQTMTPKIMQENEKVQQANKVMIQLIKSEEPFDLIGLIFNIDIETFQKITKQFDIHIYHK